MNRLRISRNFWLDEFICPEIYGRFGHASRWFLRLEIVEICQYIRTQTGKAIIVNNWYTGGPYEQSGLRPLTGDVGAEHSLHRYGCAADIKVADMTPFQVKEFIQAHWPQLQQIGLTTIENIKHTPTWTHLDCRNTGSSKLLIVNP